MSPGSRRRRFRLASVAGAWALLLGAGVAATADGGASNSTYAAFRGDGSGPAVESGDGRIRSRMTAVAGTTRTSLIFEVHLRDRMWMTPDERLVRIVVRTVPYGDPGGPFRNWSTIAAAATLPAPATGFTYFTATLDVTGLRSGEYTASVELLARGTTRPSVRGANVIDRATHRYSAPAPLATETCCLLPAHT
jgi:hypothetical protein